jgi:hypothetical protein
MAKGYKTPGSGKQKGTPNKKTVAALVAASQSIGAIKRAGDRKAIEILNELAQTARGLVALYQQRIMTAEGLRADAKADDVSQFWEAMKCATTIAKALAPFQDPTLSAIKVQMPTPLLGEGARMIGSNPLEEIQKMTDAITISRTYARIVKGGPVA